MPQWTCRCRCQCQRIQSRSRSLSTSWTICDHTQTPLQKQKTHGQKMHLSNASYLSQESFKNRLPVVIYLAAITVAGTLGNIFIFLVYWFRFQRCATRVFVLAMAVCDLITCIIGLPLQIITIRYAYDVESDAFCKIMFAIATFTTQGSGFILVVVALDRFFRVWRPYSQHLNYRRAVKVVCVVIIFTGALFTPFIPMYGIHSVDRNGEHTLDPNKSVASMCWVADVEAGGPLTKAYGLIIFISFFAGFLFMAPSYIYIGVKLRNQTIITRQPVTITADNKPSTQPKLSTTIASTLDLPQLSGSSNSENKSEISTAPVHRVGPRTVTKHNPVDVCSEPNSPGTSPPFPSSDATVKGKSDIVQMTDVPPFATDDERGAEKYSGIKMATQSRSLPTKLRTNYLIVPDIGTINRSKSAPTRDILKSAYINEEFTLKRTKSSQPQRAEISPPSETTVKEVNFPVKDTPELEDANLPVIDAPELEDANSPVNDAPELEHANSPVNDAPELEDANSPVNDAPELEHANSPVNDAPELEDANSPVNDAPELEHANSPVNDAPELEHANSPVNDVPELEQANSPVNDAPELEHVILTEEIPQSAEKTTPQRLISFSLAPMPMTVPRGVVSTQSILKHSSPADKPSALKVKLVQLKMITKSWFQKPVHSKHHRRVRSRTTLTMSILTLFYVINWLPHLIARLMRTDPVNWCENFVNCGYNMYAVSLRSYYLNSSANVFVYGLCNKKFRDESRCLLRTLWRRQQQ